MVATRCPACGETRWNLTGLPLERASACTMCGEELVTERRVPGRRFTGAPTDERREATSSTPPRRP